MQAHGGDRHPVTRGRDETPSSNGTAARRLRRGGSSVTAHEAAARLVYVSDVSAADASAETFAKRLRVVARDRASRDRAATVARPTRPGSPSRPRSCSTGSGACTHRCQPGSCPPDRSARDDHDRRQDPGRPPGSACHPDGRSLAVASMTALVRRVDARRRAPWCGSAGDRTADHGGDGGAGGRCAAERPARRDSSTSGASLSGGVGGIRRIDADTGRERDDLDSRPAFKLVLGARGTHIIARRRPSAARSPQVDAGGRVLRVIGTGSGEDPSRTDRPGRVSRATWSRSASDPDLADAALPAIRRLASVSATRGRHPRARGTTIT